MYKYEFQPDRKTRSILISDTKILIIDDEADILDSLKEVFEDKVNQVEIAQSNEEIQEKLQSNDYQLIICDISMPVMCGDGVIEHARKIKNYTPFIFYTGHLGDDFMLDVLEFGIYDIIIKPNFSELQDSVLKCLSYGNKYKLFIEKVFEKGAEIDFFLKDFDN